MTTFTTKQIDELSAILAGEKLSRSPTKDKAIARLVLLAGQSGIETRQDMPGVYAVLEQDFEAAKGEVAGWAEAAGSDLTPVVEAKPKKIKRAVGMPDAGHLDDDELQDPDAEAAAYADGKGYAEAPRRLPTRASDFRPLEVPGIGVVQVPADALVAEPPRGPSPATLGAQAAKDDDAERLHEISRNALAISQAEMDAADRVAVGHWKIAKDGVTIEIKKRKGLNEYVASIGECTGDKKNYYAAIRAAVDAYNRQGA